MTEKVKNICFLTIAVLLTITIFLGVKLLDSNRELTKLRQEVIDLKSNVESLKNALEKVNDEENSYIIPITYDELMKMQENNQTFPLVVTQATCINCVKFKPVLNKVLNEYSLIAYEIDLLTLSSEEYSKFENMYDVKGTPTTLFIEKGEEKSTTNRIVGYVNEFEVVNYLKENNYIKK